MKSFRRQMRTQPSLKSKTRTNPLSFPTNDITVTPSVTVMSLVGKDMLHVALRRYGDGIPYRVRSVSVSPIGYGVMNTVTHDLLRVRGEIETEHGVQSFSFVRKTMGLEPLGEGRPSFETSDDPTHWNYWKREYLAYVEPWLPSSTLGITLPTCYASRCADATHAEVWLEDIATTPATQWSLGRVAKSAYHLGLWQGDLANSHAMTTPWLSENWLCVLAKSRLTTEAERTIDAANWTSPLMNELFEPELRVRVENIWNHREKLLDVLDAHAQTITHYDFRAPNLFDGTRDDTIVIDWQFVGRGPFGQDLVSIVIDNVFMNVYPPDALDELARQSITSYLSGLREAGWKGSDENIATVFGATAALRFGVACGWLVLLANNADAAQQQEEAFDRPIRELLRDRLVAVRYSLSLGERVLGSRV